MSVQHRDRIYLTVKTTIQTTATAYVKLGAPIPLRPSAAARARALALVTGYAAQHGNAIAFATGRGAVVILAPATQTRERHEQS